MTQNDIEKDIRWIREKYQWSHRSIAQALGVSKALVQKVLAKSEKRAA